MIYLDNSATTRVRQEVAEAMRPYLDDEYGNPSSIHASGRRAKSAIRTAREQVAALLNCEPEEIYFSSCGTLSNNVALIGRARFAEANGHGRHLITTAIEHPSVSGPAKYLQSIGWNVTFLKVDSEGCIRIDDLLNAITGDTSIISVMWANNEIGSLQPIAEIAAIAAERGIYCHTDAVQAVGKVPIDLSNVSASTLALSGHKFFAPKGIGALFVRKLCNLMPIVFGGGQEMGLFAGTEGTANIVGLGVAAECARKELPRTIEELREMQSLLIQNLMSFPTARITGPSDMERRLPGHVSLSLPGAEGEAMVMRADLKGLCVSSGSACHQGIIEPSAVLKALELSDREALGSLRISAGKFNTMQECETASQILLNIFKALTKDPSTAATA